MSMMRFEDLISECERLFGRKVEDLENLCRATLERDWRRLRDGKPVAVSYDGYDTDVVSEVLKRWDDAANGWSVVSEGGMLIWEKWAPK